MSDWNKHPLSPRISCYFVRDDDGNKSPNAHIIHRAILQAIRKIQNGKSDEALSVLDDICIALEQIE